MNARKAFTYVIHLPPGIAHELTHIAVAKLWAEDVDIDLRSIEKGLGWNVNWGEGVSPWQVALASLAPFIAGMLALGVGMVLWILNGPSMPESVVEILWVAILSVWWAVYTVPSPEDVYEAVNGGDK